MVFCLNPNCRHQERLDVEGYADDVTVPWFGSRMVCSKCGIIGGCTAKLERAAAEGKPDREAVAVTDEPELAPAA